MPVSADILKLDNIRKEINGRLVLDSICLNIKRDRNFGFLGPGGSGKSLLAGIIAGAYKPDKGELLVKVRSDGKNLTGIIPHIPAIYEDSTILGNLRFFGSLNGLKRKEFKSAAEHTLKLCGLAEKKKCFAAGLTALEKHKLNIACGIIHQPEIMLFDEPGYGLDPPERDLITGLVENIAAGRNTVLIFSRNSKTIESICSSAALICQGKIIASGTIDELRQMISSRAILRLCVDEIRNIDFQKLGKLSDVVSAGSSDSDLIIEFRTEKPALNSIFAELKKQKISVLSVCTDYPDLGTVFETLTGFNASDEEAG